MTSIGSKAFYACNPAYVILLCTTAPSVDTDSFTGTYTIYYPLSGTGYNAGNWPHYGSRMKSNQEPTPNATVDYIAEKLTGLMSNATYAVNDTVITVDADGTIAIHDTWFGTTISLVRKGDNITTVDSEEQTITLAARPAAPSCTVTQPSASSSTGTIYGITATMQYSTNGGSTWIDGNGAAVTGLSPGTVLIRVKATANAPAGRIQSITINEYSGGSTSVSEIKSGESITAANLEQLVSDGKTLTVTGDNGAKLVFDTEALKGIASQASDDIKVEIKDVSLTYKEDLPGKLVFSLTVSSGSGTISDFGGKVTVYLPYELKDGERAEDVTVWHLADDGTITEIPCTYDPVTKLATFTVTHFSLYAVGVDAKKPWINPFSDVSESDWFYSAVEYVTENGLFTGTSATTFSPGSPMTRAMLWTVLGRLDGQPLYGSGVYDAARDWAMRAGITDGTNPDANISREQIVTILWRYAGSPKAGGDLGRFSDSGKVSGYAVEAMAWAVENGIITGADGALMPQGNATRAQVAAILQRFIEGKTA